MPNTNFTATLEEITGLKTEVAGFVVGDSADDDLWGFLNMLEGSVRQGGEIKMADVKAAWATVKAALMVRFDNDITGTTIAKYKTASQKVSTHLLHEGNLSWDDD